MGKKQRQSNVELFRIIMIFAIVMHHSILYGFFEGHLTLTQTYVSELFASLGKVGVAGFMMITGYFSIHKMKNNKASLQSTHRIVWFYSLLYLILFWHTGEVSRSLAFKALFPIIGGNYWFVTSFMMTMLLAPFINRGFQALEQKESKQLLFVLMILLTVLQLVPHQELALGNTMLFILFYLTGGYIRQYVDPKQVARWKIIGLIIMNYIVMNIGNFISTYFGYEAMPFSSNESVFVYLMATLAFILFLGFDLGSIRWINTISSMTFAVYLIHDNPIVREFLWRKALKLHKLDHLSLGQMALAIVVSSLIIFIFGLVIESIRLTVVSLFKDKKTSPQTEANTNNKLTVEDNDLDIAYTVALPKITRAEYRKQQKRR